MKKISLFFAALAVAFSANAIDVPASAGNYVKLFEDGDLSSNVNEANAPDDGAVSRQGFATQTGGYATIPYPGGDDFLICAAGANDITVTATEGFVTMISRLSASSGGFATNILFGLGEDATLTDKKTWANWAAMSESSMKIPAKGDWQVQIFKLDPAFNNTPYLRVMIEQWAGRDGFEIKDIFISENKPDFGIPAEFPESAGNYQFILKGGELQNTAEAFYGGYTQIGDYISLSGGTLVLGAAGSNVAVTTVDATTGFVTMNLRLVSGQEFNPDFLIGLGVDATNDKKEWSAWAAMPGADMPAAPSTAWQQVVFKLDPALFGAEPAWFRIFVDAGAAGVLEIKDIVLSQYKPDFGTTVGIAETAAIVDAVPVAYYSILGAQLSAEPASGIYIIKYSDGKSVKVVK